MTVTGTNLYDKHQNKIYPYSYASVVYTYQGNGGNQTTVEESLKKIWEQISENDGSQEAINNIIIEVKYQPSTTYKESEIKLSQKEWSDTFELPTEENPYIWKRTKYSFNGADDSQSVIIYEIVSSDISVIIQTIYTRTSGITPVIEYKQKMDEEGNPLYIDSSGKETTNVTETKAYDYNYYWDGSKANSLNKLPPSPEDADYKWTDYPQDISLSFTAVFMSRRIRQNGIWGPFSTPAQYGQWPTN